MTALLIILTLVEAVALVAVLALFLHLLAGRLNSIAETLTSVHGHVGAVEKDVGILKVGAPVINRRLTTIAQTLARVADKAGMVARR